MTKTKKNIKLIDKKNFECFIYNKHVKLHTLTNKNGLTTQITNYGGRIVSLWVPDSKGVFDDVVLGYDTLQGYLNSNEIYFGATIGRYGNRIANSKFELNNITYTLVQNEDGNHLHGGKNGFCNVIWESNQISNSELELKYLSADGEEGYPGNLNVNVRYKLTAGNELKITYKAITDKATPINLTNHSFFNLEGAGKSDINQHILQINAQFYTPINKYLIPTGTIEPVKNTPFDFTKPKEIKQHINTQNNQLKHGFGYDHNFVLDNLELREVARIIEPKSQRFMEVITNEPGLQFYGGNFLNGKDIGKNNMAYNYRSAFCLETQHFPNSPNQSNFPSTILEPGETYKSKCIYKFGLL